MVWMGSGLMWIIEDLYIYVYTFKYKKATVSVINYVHLFVPQDRVMVYSSDHVRNNTA